MASLRMGHAMRWFVEISAWGHNTGKSAIACVEAVAWQSALQRARALRGDAGTLHNFSIELTDEGVRAIDPEARVRYVIRRAPDEAPLTQEMDPPAPPPVPRKRPAAHTVAFSSSGVALVRPPPEEMPAQGPVPGVAPPVMMGSQAAPNPVAPPVTMGPQAASNPVAPPADPSPGGPMPGPRKRPPAQTIAYSLSDVATLREADPALPQPAVEVMPIPKEPAVPPPPLDEAEALEPLPSYVLVARREEDPSERSPLRYRELVYAVSEGTTDDEARRLILDRFQAVRASLAKDRPGKLVNIAIFDHTFEGKPRSKPIVTLTWKDWKNDAPELHFPRRDEVVGIGAGPSAPPSPSPVEPARSEPAPPGLVNLSVTLPSAGIEPLPPITMGPQAAPNPVPPVAPPVTMEPQAVPNPVLPKAPPVPRPLPTGHDGAGGPKPRVAEGATREKKRLTGDDLLAALFDALGDLHFLRDALEGAEFVLALLLEKLPSEACTISLFDGVHRHFIVVRHAGGGGSLVGSAIPLEAPLASAALRKRHAVLAGVEVPLEPYDVNRFRALHLDPRQILCAPMERGGRVLGLLELVNLCDGHSFGEGDANALTYIGQQFAEFLEARGVITNPDAIRSPHGAGGPRPSGSNRGR